MTNNGTGKYNYLAREVKMTRTKLYFDVRDNDYFERLGQYIMANYGMYFEITDDKDKWPDAYTVSDYINRRNKKGVFLIKEDKGDVYKFSPASEVCSGLMKVTNPAHGNMLPSKEAALAIGVTSAAGGAGKSVISKAISCRLAEKGMKVLYINFNPFSTNDCFFPGQNINSLTRLRYYLRKNDCGISSKIKELASRNAGKRIDFIVNDKPSGDGFISSGEAVLLMNELAGGTPYDAVVFDLSSYPDDGQVEIMKRSSVNILVCKYKIDERHIEFRKFLEKKGVCRITEVLNFCSRGDSCIPEARDIFSEYPGVFWNAVGRLCVKLEEKHDNVD
jgi:hypothetical protein